MDKTSHLKDIILKKYPSVRAFANAAGIPYGTIVSALNNGIEGMSYGKVKVICDCLNIDCGTFEPIVTGRESMTGEEKRLLSYFARLDEVKRNKVLEYINDIS